MSDRCIFVITVLLDSFSQSEMSIHTFWVYFYSVLEIFGSPLTLTQISQQVCQVNAATKVIVIDS